MRFPWVILLSKTTVFILLLFKGALFLLNSARMYCCHGSILSGAQILDIWTCLLTERSRVSHPVSPA